MASNARLEIAERYFISVNHNYDINRLMLLYHFKPDNMQGNTLYPLNALKRIFPEMYEEYFKRKYSWRKNLTTVKLPVLDCLWNDVVHFSPIDMGIVIHTLRRVFKQNGKKLEDRYKGRQYFAVDSDKLGQDKLFIFLNRVRLRDMVKYPLDQMPSEFVTFKGNADQINFNVPQEQLDDYDSYAKDPSIPPLLFTRTLHVLYKGNIDMSDLLIKETA
ncbi:hypothetical protein ACFL6Y_11120 [Elusimicrobiota bacterium]